MTEGRGAFDRVSDGEAVHQRHIHVQKDDIDSCLRGESEPARTIVGECGGMTQMLYAVFEGQPDKAIIVNDKDVEHG